MLVVLMIPSRWKVVRMMMMGHIDSTATRVWPRMVTRVMVGRTTVGSVLPAMVVHMVVVAMVTVSHWVAVVPPPLVH